MKKFKVQFHRASKYLLKKNKPDAVIVATPNQFHEKHTISFLNAKIPVLLEKQISNNYHMNQHAIEMHHKTNIGIHSKYTKNNKKYTNITKKSKKWGQLGPSLMKLCQHSLEWIETNLTTPEGL